MANLTTPPPKSYQRLSGSWYFHRVPRRSGTVSNPTAVLGYRGGSRKGLDITLGSPVAPIISTNSHYFPSTSSTLGEPVPVRGGVLLRSLRRVSDGAVVSGPSLLVDELLRVSKASSIAELVTDKWQGDLSAFCSPPSEGPDRRHTFLFIGAKNIHSPSQVYKSPRIGLDLSHPATCPELTDQRVQYVSKPYRYFILPHLLTANGRGQTFLGVYDHYINNLRVTEASLASKIVSSTGLQLTTVSKYLSAYQEAISSGKFERFVGSKGKGASASPVPFLQLIGALRRCQLA
ncbi:hypothetical protein BC834DRAFT_676068 [Gloeopeniophorella convolvens]|nr:hypothetical protein BC834DRAFT_676068 [Gloeopeniophorella convolvens]